MNIPPSARKTYDRLAWTWNPGSDKESGDAIVKNLLLHWFPNKVSKRSLSWNYSFYLGTIAFVLFMILVVTGVILMFLYVPSVERAYGSVKDLEFVVSFGWILRGSHRIAAHLMVAVVFLHMVRVFLTGAYKNGSAVGAHRPLNWIVGLVLLIATLLLSFTGYLLPWDQLAYWAITIGANIAQSPQELTDALGITESFDPGGFQRQLLLGSDVVGAEALIRFYVLHVMVLPLLLGILLAVHFWRIRKDGGLARPADAEERLGPPPPDIYPVFTEAPTRTYHLAAIVRGRTEAVGRGPENTVPSMPHLFYAELGVLMATILLCVALAILVDAPLKELADPNVPENPAKAPWYFLGLQELVSFSAFMGGIGIPAIVLIGLGLIPFLDREENGTGLWFGGPGGRGLAAKAALVGVGAALVIEAVAIRFGWLREWFPDVPQWVITCINPGTILAAVYGLFSIWLVRRHPPARAGAVGLFTCFLCGFVVLTIIGTYFRGPNWVFYWSPSEWPKH